MRRILRNLLQEPSFTNVDEAEDGQPPCTSFAHLHFEFIVGLEHAQYDRHRIAKAVRADNNLEATVFPDDHSQPQANIIEEPRWRLPHRRCSPPRR